MNIHFQKKMRFLPMSHESLGQKRRDEMLRNFPLSLFLPVSINIYSTSLSTMSNTFEISIPKVLVLQFSFISKTEISIFCDNEMI